jgi:hypothetical protein
MMPTSRRPYPPFFSRQLCANLDRAWQRHHQAQRYTVVAFFLDTHQCVVETVSAPSADRACLTKDDDRAYTVVAVFEGALTPAWIDTGGGQ